MKIFTKLSLSLFALAFFSSCSNIADDERLIYVEPELAQRNVLIEDFTGQRCVNCPKATEVIEEIKKVYGENIISVAIHSGPNGVDKDGAYKGVAFQGLANSIGNEYWNEWFTSGTGQPIAKINRGEATNDYNNWSAAVAQAMQASTEVQIDAVTNYDQETRQLTINTDLIGKANTSAKLQILLTEDSIQSLQVMPDGSYNSYYIHNHVFRDVVNGTWGEDFTFGEGIIGKQHTYTIPEKYNAEHMNVVIFVYNASGVEQVISVPVIKNIAPL
ncbi:MAG: Omp28 family outer membrane lipoprotein [Prevotellaceae bacterium]|nr:Omp28 family outer membrane lipoprotein [Prevotellaceae bacterium]